jgi:hypothetical protein
LSENHYEPTRTALLLVDPYNDFLSDAGKIWPMVKGVAEEVGLLDHLRAVVVGARSVGVKIFIVPHRRWEPGDYEGSYHVNPSQRQVQQLQPFAKDTRGGEWHPDFEPRSGDVIVKEHWGQSGFANTDLDFQLKRHDCELIALIEREGQISRRVALCAVLHHLHEIDAAVPAGRPTGIGLGTTIAIVQGGPNAHERAPIKREHERVLRRRGPAAAPAKIDRP